MASFVREAKLQDMNESWALITLSELLTGLARSKYNTAVAVTAIQYGVIFSWPQTVQRFETGEAIKNGFVELRTTAQK